MAKHVQALKVNTFRGIKNLELNGLSDINIITGDNNVGKTSLLELLRLLKAPIDFRSLLLVGRKATGISSSRFSSFEALVHLFDIDDTDKKFSFTVMNETGENYNIEVSCEIYEEIMYDEEIENINRLGNYMAREIDEEIHEDEKQAVDVNRMELSFSVNGKVLNKKSFYDFERIRSLQSPKYSVIDNVVYISPFRHAEGYIFLKDVLNNSELYEEMLQVLKEFDEDIVSINADRDGVKYNPGIVYKILTKSHKEALPLNVYGDGMKKAILLMSAVISAKNGILLVDEFETAIHTSAMNEVFEWLIKTCLKLNVQLFLTSHSEEGISKLLNCSVEYQKNMSVITLMKRNTETKARVLTGEKAILLEDEYGMELR